MNVTPTNWRVAQPMPHWPAREVLPVLADLRDENGNGLDRWNYRGHFVAVQIVRARCGDKLDTALFDAEFDGEELFAPWAFLRPPAHQCHVVLWSRLLVRAVVDDELVPCPLPHALAVARALRIDSKIDQRVVLNHVVMPRHVETEALVPPLTLPSQIQASIMLRSNLVPPPRKGTYDEVAVEVRLTGLTLSRPV